MVQKKIWIENLEEAKAKRKLSIPIIKKNSYYSVPHDPKEIKKLADEMVNLVYENQELINLDIFPISKRLSPYRFYKLADKDYYFKEALEVARHVIGIRIQNGWMSKDLDSKACAEILPQYSHAYKQWINEKIIMADKAKALSGQPGNFNIYMDSFKLKEKETSEDKLGNTNQVECIQT